MIELIFVYFAIQNDMMTIGQDVRGELCRRIQVATSMVETRPMYDAVDKRWPDDESARESFYAFWENRDTCNPK